jgi:RNA polymerase sigma factor (sigma-70 family)
LSEPKPEPSDAFLALLDPADPAQAHERYEQLRFQLIRYFSSWRCPDPADLADETLARAFVGVTKGAVIDTTLTAYVWGIAKHVLSGHQKAAARAGVVPVEEAAAILVDDSARATDARIALREALARLPEDDREVLERYFTEDRRRLAGDLGITEQTLRVRVHRIRRRLREGIDRSGA